MKKIKIIVIWSILAVYLILISGFVSESRREMLCNKLDINISDSLSKRFIIPADINDLLNKQQQLPLGKLIIDVNTKEIEKTVLANTLVKKCRVYTTIDGKLNIDVWQREPVVRIIDRNGRNYYLDNEGSIIVLSKRFTPHLLVVNGNIKTPFAANLVENIYNKKYNHKANKLREIHKLAMYISHHEFWNAQIVQVYVDKSGEFELIPRIGPHLIELGAIDDYERKLNKLWVFYNEGLNSVGWNKYLNINLKYRDQIVCTKI